MQGEAFSDEHPSDELYLVPPPLLAFVGQRIGTTSCPSQELRPFASVSELVEALREFMRMYNDQCLIERHGFRTPSQVRAELTGGARAVA